MKTHASAAFSGNGIGPGVMGARYRSSANHRPEFLPRATALLSILKGKSVAEGIVAPLLDDWLCDHGAGIGFGIVQELTEAVVQRNPTGPQGSTRPAQHPWCPAPYSRTSTVPGRTHHELPVDS